MQVINWNATEKFDKFKNDNTNFHPLKEGTIDVLSNNHNEATRFKENSIISLPNGDYLIKKVVEQRLSKGFWGANPIPIWSRLQISFALTC